MKRQNTKRSQFWTKEENRLLVSLWYRWSVFHSFKRNTKFSDRMKVHPRKTSFWSKFRKDTTDRTLLQNKDLNSTCRLLCYKIISLQLPLQFRPTCSPLKRSTLLTHHCTQLLLTATTPMSLDKHSSKKHPYCNESTHVKDRVPLLPCIITTHSAYSLTRVPSQGKQRHGYALDTTAH